MIYELRVYDVVPGKLAALNDRFEHTTNAYFEKYGVDVNVGLAIGGLVVTIPAWYLSGYTQHWLNNLMPSIYI